MPNYGLLTNEIDADPASLGLSWALSDQDNANLLNTVNQSVDRSSIATSEIIEATVPADYATLSDGEKRRYLTFVSTGMLNPNAANAVAAFQAMFSGTTTVTNLAALRTETRSRANVIGFGEVYAGHVSKARP